MKSTARMIVWLQLFVSLVSLSQASESRQNKNTLWYDQPGETWPEALPIGSGRLGGMILGQPAEEVFYLNEDTVWSGEPHDYTNVGAYQHLTHLRELILDEKYDEAKEFGAQHSLGVPASQQGYQHLGLLHLTFPGHDDYTQYHRQLDMSTALIDVSYQAGEATFTRQILASYPDQVIAMQLDCDKPGQITFEARFSTGHKQFKVKQLGDNTLVLEGVTQKRSNLGAKLRFQSQVHVSTKGGSVSVEDHRLRVTAADSACLRVVAATNYVNYQDISADPEKRCQGYLSKARQRSFADIRQRHTTDHGALFNRVRIDLGGTQADLQIPTDQLLAHRIEGDPSALFDEQLFQFARYLTIAAARSGTQPMNLVGIWAEGLDAPWGGKWTLNINAELNTWPAETTGLAECHEPLLHLLEDLRVTGRTVAKEHYNCRGFVAHHNTDLWRGAAPVDTAIHGLWTMGGAWLSRHIYEHYDFSRDMDYLRQSYPTIKEAALFFVDFLTVDQDGYLSTCPAISFEQGFRKTDGTVGRLTYGPTMDNQILRDLFTNCINASEILGIDEDLRQQITEIRAKLRATQIDPQTGRIMEWAFRAEKPGRGGQNCGQTAPLWAVSPGRQITPQDTPALAQAAVKYLEHYIPGIYGYETGGSWVTGTLLNLWARLGCADQAYATVNKAITERLYPNMMMHFYTQNYFQIDGNMGTTAGITEMLLQSHRRDKQGDPIIDLLPALPKAWPTGSVAGLRARGAFVVDVAWKEGRFTKANITSLKGTPLTVCYDGKSVQYETNSGAEYILNGKTFAVE